MNYIEDATDNGPFKLITKYRQMLFNDKYRGRSAFLDKPLIKFRKFFKRVNAYISIPLKYLCYAVNLV